MYEKKIMIVIYVTAVMYHFFTLNKLCQLIIFDFLGELSPLADTRKVLTKKVLMRKILKLFIWLRSNLVCWR